MENMDQIDDIVGYFEQVKDINVVWVYERRADSTANNAQNNRFPDPAL